MSMDFNTNTMSYNTDFWTPKQWEQFGASGGTIGKGGSLMMDGVELSTGATSILPDWLSGNNLKDLKYDYGYGGYWCAGCRWFSRSLQ